ncbi:MAG: DUF1732 domain-containing protein, partial [Candidatus Cloacimonadota bacterium]|nr:DUF1732 domain-containing protein [Candidatus Cloacimonadota bacterium]
MKSMTGFGKQVYSDEKYQIEVQIKSVNSRYFDFRVSLSSEFYQFEYRFKKLINKYIKRGKVDLYISFVSSIAPKINVNKNKIIELKKSYNEVLALIGNSPKFPINKLFEQKDIFIESKQNWDQNLYSVIENTVEKAVIKHQEMALQEGKQMYVSTQDSIDKISASLNAIEKSFPDFRDQMYNQIRVNVSEIIENIDEDLEKRILTEVAMYVEKADINEEIIRLKSHIEKIADLIEQEKPTGKSFNFVLQEMHREITTIGSKYNSSKLFKEILTIKEEI